MNNNEITTNELDHTDQEIIKQLNQDGRKSYRQIAKELNLSVGTITNRVNKLRETGIIKGFQIQLDYAALGYNIETLIGIDNTGTIENIINKYPENIITAHKTTGQYNTLLITRFKDTTELNNFLENITKEENINKTYTQLILSSIGS